MYLGFSCTGCHELLMDSTITKCGPCESKADTNDLKSVSELKTRFNIAKWRAKKRGLDWQISLELYADLVSEDCFYCTGYLGCFYGTALDRMDNLKGYVEENVVPCCWECNRVKSDVLSFNEMRVAMAAVLELRKRSPRGKTRRQ